MRFASQLVKVISLACLLSLGLPVQAEINLGEVGMLSQDSDTAPIPKGLVVGGVLLAYNARYEAQKDAVWPIPGAIYFGNDFMYLGDRARYYFYKDKHLATFIYGRVRTGNLDPADAPALAGMIKRKWQFEAGLGANIITPYALISTRFASDITGNTHGQEALLWADFPIHKDRLLVMPGFGVMKRNSKLANYYFGGISAAEATPTRPQYDTGSTWSPMVALVSSYRYNKNWLAMVTLNIEHFDKNIANSPIVQHANEYTFLAGVGYTW
ncbi:MipA/OmpV family protein [Undibacterium sp. Ren11W]|uniref:MipA/OmpV family protein n=1 Tax=Undibacterium sp. Ren11W TaxID=3413045 RepID=UPI003BF19A1A